MAGETIEAENVGRADRRSADEMRAVCGDTIAVILATGSRADLLAPVDGEPALRQVVKTAYRAQVAMVYVITVPDIAQEITNLAHSVRRRKNDPFIEVLACEPYDIQDRTRQAGGLAVYGVPFALLEVAHTLSEGDLGGHEAAVFLRGEDGEVRADDVYELCVDAFAHAQADVMVCRGAGGVRFPYLFSMKFLNALIGAFADGGAAALAGVSCNPFEHAC